MSHTHDDDRLTFGCDACIQMRARDQELADLRSMSDYDLLLAGADGSIDSGDIAEECERRYGHWLNWPVLGDFL